MSYDISFRVKVDGVDKYIESGGCDANVTWNVRDIIQQTTGLPWLNEENNGLCVDVIPAVQAGLSELIRAPEKYRHLEASNGWGTVGSVRRFFQQIIKDWNEYVQWTDPDIVAVTTFWVV